MNIRNIIKTITLCITYTTLSGQTHMVFLENNYGKPIYYRSSLDNYQTTELNNGQRAPLCSATNLSQRSLPRIQISFSSSSGPFLGAEAILQRIIRGKKLADNNAILRINPQFSDEKFSILWESTHEQITIIPPINPQIKKNRQQLIKKLQFIRMPVYYQGQEKQQREVTPGIINRSKNMAINMAIQIIENEPYNTQTLYEVYEIINRQVPFQLQYQDEIELKNDALNFIRQEMQKMQ